MGMLREQRQMSFIHLIMAQPPEFLRLFPGT